MTGMGIVIPPPRVVVPDVDLYGVDSDGFRKDGKNVQPALKLRMATYRVGVLYGLESGWATGITIPWHRNRVTGRIGGLPATGVGTGFGDVALIGKKQVWTNGTDSVVVATVGVELPTGKDDATFAQDNAVTNGYYTGGQHRMPLGWQAGSGSVDGYLAVAYGRSVKRISYTGLIATKLHTSADADVKIGNILIAAVNGTYGISRTLAFSLGLTLRTQADDSYPQAPPPGVDQGALVGTTIHGTTLFIDPSVRINIANRVTAGIGLRYPIVKPDDGMVPDVSISLIFYPEFF